MGEMLLQPFTQADYGQPDNFISRLVVAQNQSFADVYAQRGRGLAQREVQDVRFLVVVPRERSGTIQYLQRFHNVTRRADGRLVK